MQQDPETTKDPVEFVQRLLNEKDKYDAIIAQSFGMDKSFQNTLNQAFEHFINLNQRSPEFISLFMDDKLRKGLKVCMCDLFYMRNSDGCSSERAVAAQHLLSESRLATVVKRLCLTFGCGPFVCSLTDECAACHQCQAITGSWSELPPHTHLRLISSGCRALQYQEGTGHTAGFSCYNMEVALEVLMTPRCFES